MKFGIYWDWTDWKNWIHIFLRGNGNDNQLKTQCLYTYKLPQAQEELSHLHDFIILILDEPIYPLLTQSFTY